MIEFFKLIGIAFSGGATGLIGVFVQRYFDHKKHQQDVELVKINNEHARALAQIEVDKANRIAQAQEHVADVQAQASIRSAELEAQAKMEQAAAQSYMASLEADRATYLDPKSQARSKFARNLMAIVDFFRGMIRPVLTLYLVIVVTYMYSWATQLTGSKNIPDAEVAKFVTAIVDTLLYLSTTCVVWWFGVRPTQKDKRM